MGRSGLGVNGGGKTTQRGVENQTTWPSRRGRRNATAGSYGGEIAGMSNLATLDRRIAPEGSPDRLEQRLRAVDDEEMRCAGIEPALDEIVAEAEQFSERGYAVDASGYQIWRLLEWSGILPA